MSETAPTPDSNPAPDNAAEAAPEKSLETLLAEALARADDQREAMLRALADAENARKRAQADVAAAHKYGLERFAQGLLPVIDSLEAALEVGEATVETLKSGAELTLRQLGTALEKAAITPIAPAAGERFDPHRHQAMASVEADAEPNTIVAVMQKGWALHDRILRPALVSVARARAAAAPDAAAATPPAPDA